MKKKAFLATLAMVAMAASADDFPWMDTTLSFEERAKL